ncbi:MAG: hypothetical protein PVI21_00140 [Candidatus Woesebacteria bacterium]
MKNRLKSLITLNNGVLLVAALITFSWVWGSVEAIGRNFALQQQVDTLSQEVEYYSLQNETLEFQQKYYQTNEFLELSARERLNKASDGEKVLVLQKNTVSAKEEGAQATPTDTEQRSNIEQWLYFLFANKK